jgi:hypothetical protein
VRDEHEYVEMAPAELASHLQRLSKELALAHEVRGRAAAEEHRYFTDGYRNSRGKSVAERRMDGELSADLEHRELLEAEATLASLQTIHGLVVILLELKGRQ